MSYQSTFTYLSYRGREDYVQPGKTGETISEGTAPHFLVQRREEFWQEANIFVYRVKKSSIAKSLITKYDTIS